MRPDRRVTAALLALLLLGGCTICDQPTGTMATLCKAVLTPPPAPVDPGSTTPPADAPYIVTRGQRLERTLQVPAAVEFSVTGLLPSVEDGGPRDNTTLVWSYDPARGWQGGNPVGAFAVSLRDYALKCYHADGVFAGQTRYNGSFTPEKTYRVRLEVGPEETAAWIDGREVARRAVRAPADVVIGIGWPPEQRPGAEGARVTGVVWR